MGALQPALQQWVDDHKATVDADDVAVIDEGLGGLLGDALVQLERKQRRFAVEALRAICQRACSDVVGEVVVVQRADGDRSCC